MMDAPEQRHSRNQVGACRFGAKSLGIFIPEEHFTTELHVASD